MEPTRDVLENARRISTVMSQKSDSREFKSSGAVSGAVIGQALGTVFPLFVVSYVELSLLCHDSLCFPNLRVS